LKKLLTFANIKTAHKEGIVYKGLILFILTLLLFSCSHSEEVSENKSFDEDVWVANLKDANPFVVKAWIEPETGNTPDITVCIRVSYEKVLETQNNRLDTLLTPNVLKKLDSGMYERVSMTIEIPDMERMWRGYYDEDNQVFNTEAGYEYLCPVIDRDTGTFIVIIPVA
jgi:hypothetical protein